VLLVSVLGLGALLPSAATASTQRIKVGLFGDSVTEGIVIPNFERVGLAAALTTEETHYGFRAGGEGLIAVNQYQWRFSAYGILGFQTIPTAGWALVGSQDGSIVQPGTDGPSGYSAVSVSPTATASATIPDPDVEVLYTTSVLPCSFTVTSGTRSWTIDTYDPSQIEPEAAEYPLTLGAGSHVLTVHASSCGLVFDGVVAEDPVRPGPTQIQIDNDGHAARPPSTDLAARIQQAIVEQHYKVTVFLYGYIGELIVSRGATARQYERALMTRARLARLNGGRCLIVQPTPLMDIGAAKVRLISGLERAVARQAGCTYTTGLAHLWDPQAAIDQGLTVIDGIHPTAKGYAAMARVLAPIIAKLARS
jgi:hypothetical protein